MAGSRVNAALTYIIMISITSNSAIDSRLLMENKNAQGSFSGATVSQILKIFLLISYSNLDQKIILYKTSSSKIELSSITNTCTQTIQVLNDQ